LRIFGVPDAPWGTVQRNHLYPRWGQRKALRSPSKSDCWTGNVNNIRRSIYYASDEISSAMVPAQCSK
jgi:hypothetical protein